MLPMCFKFLCYGTRGCNKLDCTYCHPKMCKTALTNVRCDRKNGFYYHKTGTIRPTSGQSRSIIPLMELNLTLYQNKRRSYPTLNHKASRPAPYYHPTTSKIMLLISLRPKLPSGIFQLSQRASYPSPIHPIITTTSLLSIPQLKQ